MSDRLREEIQADIAALNLRIDSAIREKNTLIRIIERMDQIAAEAPTVTDDTPATATAARAPRRNVQGVVLSILRQQDALRLGGISVESICEIAVRDLGDGSASTVKRATAILVQNGKVHQIGDRYFVNLPNAPSDQSEVPVIKVRPDEEQSEAAE